MVEWRKEVTHCMLKKRKSFIGKTSPCHAKLIKSNKALGETAEGERRPCITYYIYIHDICFSCFENPIQICTY